MLEALRGLLWLILAAGLLGLLLLACQDRLGPYRRAPLGEDWAPTPRVYHPNQTHRLIDLHHFKFLKLDRFNCNNPRLWVSIVSSAVNHFEHRKTIRNTWGKNRQVVFLLGLPTSNERRLIPEIERESFLHGDIVQGNFIDSYRNLTYKHMMGFLWVLSFCSGTSFVIKTDDDAFVNTFYLETYLHALPKNQSYLFCTLHVTLDQRRVLREKGWKWTVSKEEYSEDLYPQFCSGWSIIYSSDVIRELFYQAQNETYFWIDDVFITGIVAEKANITHTPLHMMAVTKRRTQEILEWDPNYYFLFCNSCPEELETLWAIMNDVTSNDL